MARRITVDVLASNGTTLVRTLTGDRARKWLDDLNDVGSWSLDVLVDHPDAAALTDGRFVRIKLDGVARFFGPVETRRKVVADPSARKAGRVVEVGGRGGLSILERAVVYPELGVGFISPDVRFFNFASADYDDSAWSPVTLLARQDDTTGANPKSPAPEEWPDPLAYWIWDSTGFTPPTAVGDVYFRMGSFGVFQTTDARVFITADDGFELYLDGAKLGAETAAGIWGKTRYFDVRLSGSYANPHCIAVKGTNLARPNPLTNGAAIIVAIAELLGGGQTVGPPILRSESYWKLLAYPSSPPGMTPGKILDVLLSEAQARGCFPSLSWSFDPFFDSDGVAWPNEIDVSFPVGTSLLDVVRKLVDEHALDVSFSPATVTLHAYVSRGGPSATVVAVGTNVNRLGFTKSPPGPNTVLGRTAGGEWVETSDGVAAAAWGRREASLSLGSAPTDEAAARQTAAFLDDHSDPVEAITDLQLEVARPYVDYDVGDTATAPTYDGGTASYRVYAIGVGEDNAGKPIVTPELVR